MIAYACGTPARKHISKAAGDSVGATFVPEANPEYRGGDAIVWGMIRGAPELIRAVRKAGNNYWHMDNGYFGRNRYYRITKNANQVTDLKEYPPDRFEKIKKDFDLRVEPWKEGNHIVLALSTPWLYRFHGTTLEKWVEDTVCSIKTDRKIVIRPKESKTPLHNDLKNAHALVTFTSNCALDALMYGIPAFVNGESCVSAVSQHLSEINEPKRFDREPLLWYLAWNMFTVGELGEGLWKEHCGFS